MVCCKKQNKIYDYVDKIHSHLNSKELELLERQFILDCIAVRQICDDYSKANPKHGSIIPPYNGQLDPYAKSYFESLNIQKLLEKTGQLDSMYYSYLFKIYGRTRHLKGDQIKIHTI
ncbi:unnamed protein product [Schistosoma rodhaini]|nr:unnamed protein product [Schistosoma rodhaini]